MEVKQQQQREEMEQQQQMTKPWLRDLFTPWMNRPNELVYSLEAR